MDAMQQVAKSAARPDKSMKPRSTSATESMENTT
jgi:hypothetical protein